MRLIDADALKEDLRQYFTDGVLNGVSAKLVFNRILHDIDNAPTVDVDELIAELTDQIIDLTDFMDSKNIFVWIDENGKIHECRSKKEREAEYKVAWLKYITGEVKTNENND